MERMMFNFRFSIFFLVGIIFIALFSSCNDKPTDLGLDIIGDTISVQTISTETKQLITKTEVFKYENKGFDNHTILIGQAFNTKAVYLTRFDNSRVPDSIQNINLSDIIEAKILLRPDTYYLSQNNGKTLSFDVLEVEKQWQKVEDIEKKYNLITYDSLFTSPANYFGQKVATFTGQIDIKDSSVNDMISFDLNPLYVKEKLLKLGEDGKVVVNWGIAFIPNESSNIINQFNVNTTKIAIDSVSRLQLIYRVGDNIDTAHIPFTANAIYTNTNNPPANSIALQQNFEWRTEFKMDLTDIPNLSGIIKSELEFTLDEENSFFGNEGKDQILWIGVYNSRADFGPISQFFLASGTLDTATGKFTIPSLSGAVEKLVRDGGKGTLILKSTSNSKNGLLNNRLDRLVFFGSECPDPEKRPKLRIAYMHYKK